MTFPNNPADTRAAMPMRGSKTVVRFGGKTFDLIAPVKPTRGKPPALSNKPVQKIESFARPALHRPSQNHLLAALPKEAFDALAPNLELVPMALGDTIYGPGRQLQYAYFPTSAIVSLHCVLESGASVEAAAVGNEGVVGIALFMGGETMSSSAVVHIAGHAYRLSRRLLRQEFDRGAAFRHLLLRHTQALMTLMLQATACNRFHTIEQQLSRWLLATLDRDPERELVMTHELVAGMLGVRRESISEAAGKLQKDGFINYRRGHITVTDRAGLEMRTCECYAVTKAEVNRLLSDVDSRKSAAA